VLDQSQDVRDSSVTTSGHRKQRSRYLIPAIPIWFGVISGAFLLTALFALMIGFLCPLPVLPQLRSLVNRQCQRLFRNAPPWVAWYILPTGLESFEWLSTTFLEKWDHLDSALEFILWIVCALNDLNCIHIKHIYPRPPFNEIYSENYTIETSSLREICQAPRSIDFMSCQSV
jgi:hypothetical protein